MPQSKFIEQRFKAAFSENAAFRALIIAALAGVASSANAALPTGLDVMFTQVQTDGLALADLVWPVVMAIFGAQLLFKLFKRFGSQI